MEITAERVLEEKGSEIIAVSPDTTVLEAIRLMVSRKIGAVMIKEGEQYVGIITERDVVYSLAVEGFDVKSASVVDHMSPTHKASHDAPLVELAGHYLGRRVRHLLIERDDRTIGILSLGDAVKARLQQKAKEAESLSRIVQTGIYDDWKWRARRRK